MAKKNKVKTVVVKCECSTCGQVSFVEANKPHAFCKGIHLGILERMPAQFRDLTNPKRKGSWIPIPPKQEEVSA